MTLSDLVAELERLKASANAGLDDYAIGENALHDRCEAFRDALDLNADVLLAAAKALEPARDILNNLELYENERIDQALAVINKALEGNS